MKAATTAIVHDRTRAGPCTLDERALVHVRDTFGATLALEVVMHHDELLTLADAARVAERSEATLRRWIRAGDLPSTTGPAPEGGGRAPALVRAGDLFGFLARSGQQPRSVAVVHADTGRSDTPPAIVHGDGARDEVAALTLALERSRMETERARMEGQLEAARVELAALRERVDLVEGERSRLEALLDEARRDRDDWRARSDAAAVELRAERERTGRPWWRRLLPGPVATD